MIIFKSLLTNSEVISFWGSWVECKNWLKPSQYGQGKVVLVVFIRFLWSSEIYQRILTWENKLGCFVIYIKYRIAFNVLLFSLSTISIKRVVFEDAILMIQFFSFVLSHNQSWSRSYQQLFFFVFRFLLLILSVCYRWKNVLNDIA